MPLPDAARIGELWRASDEALSEERRNYWLNVAFYLGQQWIWWDQNRHYVQLQADRTSETDRARTTINRIRPATDSLLGRMASRNLAFEAQVSGVDDVSIRGGRLAEFICDHERIERDWEVARIETLFNALMGGTAGVAVDWDPNAGDVVAVDPDDGSPLHLGHSQASALSIAEFTIESNSRKTTDARWWVRQSLLTPGQAQERYNLPKEPDSDATGAMSPLGRRLLTLQGGSGKGRLVSVLTYYERPNGKEKGGVVTVVGDNIVDQKDEWPFPFPYLNVQVFRCAPLPLKWTGDTFVTSARPIQVAYNQVRSAILEHARLTSNARLMIPIGGLEDDAEDLTTDVGEIVRYVPGVGEGIKYLDPPAVQRWLSDAASTLAAELDDIMHTHATSRGEISGDRNSGLALAQVSEHDDSPLGVMSRDQAQGWGRVASMVLKLYEQNAIEQRQSTVTTDRGVPVAREWTGGDLHGQTDVTVPLDQVTPRSKVATQAMITALAQAFPTVFATTSLSKLTHLLELPSAFLLSSAADSNVTRAEWENEMMAQGKPIVPREWDDHATHIREHNEFRNTPAYELLDQRYQDIFAMHQQAHQLMSSQEIATQASLEQVSPGLSAVPQAHAPMGSSTNPFDALPPAPVAGGGAMPPAGGGGQPASPQEGTSSAPAPATA
jgi:hypothetical protein